LHYLAGTWHCTYRAPAMSIAYKASYAYDRDGNTLHETTAFATGGGDQEFIAYGKRNGWTAVVLEDDGSTTIMRGAGADPAHLAFHSIYPDASIAERVDRVSANEYTIHATMRAAGKTTASVDTCRRDSPS
jgi:hypothetical protein